MSPRPLAIIAIAAAGLLAGCNLAGPNRNYDAELAHYKQIAGTVEHPQLTTPPSDNLFTPEPRTIDRNAAPQQPQEWWDMSIEEALQTALARSSVLRDLGGSVIRSPDTTRTILGPSLIATEPRFGMEAALSEFDATLATSVIAEKNDRMINNFVASGGTRFFQQDLINFQSQISKVGVAGTRMTLRGISTYDFNNASFNRFPSVWDTLYEAEIRQPLYQGAGSRFNRLAGPNGSPGFYNGVLIARVNTDISVADFEIGLRDLVSNVENAYWDLYFAFRDLDAKLQARNASLEAWKKIKIALEQGQPEGTPEREAQAREQYFRYEEDVQNALAGTLQSSTTNNNGSSGGSFRGLGGVLVSERRLRLAIGLPITDGRMIRPADDPTAAKVVFDWPTASDDAIARRPELLRQRLAVKRREMEFVAARNFLLPRFDLLGRYRVRGLGKNLIGDVTLPPDPVGDPEGLFENSSLSNLALANFQEWQLGGEVSLPIGFRRGHAAVRNAQLFVAREKAVLEEQERQVIHDLSNAIGDVERAYEIMQTSYNRRRAAQEHVVILRTKIEKEQTVTAEQLLEAERRLAEADIQYHRALVEHMLAIKNVHFEKGTLLEYGHILLSEQVSIVNSRPPAADSNQQPTPAPAPPPEAMPAPLQPMPPGPAVPQQVEQPGPPPVFVSPPAAQMAAVPPPAGLTPDAVTPAVPNAQPVAGGLPPQFQPLPVQPQQVQPLPQTPPVMAQLPPRSVSETPPPTAPTAQPIVGGLPRQFQTQQVQPQSQAPPPAAQLPPRSVMVTPPAVPNAQPFVGSLPPQLQAQQVQPQPQTPSVLVQLPPRSVSETPPQQPSKTEGLPPAPAQPPVMPPPPLPEMQGLPPLGRAANTPLLQWSRPAPQSLINIPADPYQSPIPASIQGLPPAPQAPPPQSPPPAPAVSSNPLGRIAGATPPARLSSSYIEQLWYPREPALAERPAPEAAIPAQAPSAPPQRTVWQQPVAPPRPAPPEPRPSLPQAPVWQLPVATPQPTVTPQPTAVPPANQPPPMSSRRLPQPQQEMSSQRLPAAAAEPPVSSVQRLPEAMPEPPPAFGQRLPAPSVEPQPSRLPPPAETPLEQAVRLPRL